MRLGRRSRADGGEADDDREAQNSETSGHEEQDEVAPEEVEPSPARRRPGPATRLRALLDDQANVSRHEAERQAALELEQSATPAMEQLLLHVPGSSSYEEAGATLARQAAFELDKPVRVAPEEVVDLRNPPEMRAYPEEEKLSNRVLRLTNRQRLQSARRRGPTSRREGPVRSK